MKEDCLSMLTQIVDKEHVYFVHRGNAAIKLALTIAKKKGYGKVLIQDQGGWLAYPHLVKGLKLEEVRVVTDHGVVFERMLDDHKDCVLLINSLPAYAFVQDMQGIMDYCRKNNVFVINDVTGSIGTDAARHGDIILGSFGDDKPVEIGSGGFIALSEPFDVEEADLDWEALRSELEGLDDKRNKYSVLRSRILEDLKDFEVISPGDPGINVIVRFKSEDEKEQIVDCCKKHNFKYTLCPRFIRVLDAAVSIEIKRSR